MIKKLAVTLLGALILFSCGELPELKLVDWGSRVNFSGKPYMGTLFDEWDEVNPDAVKESGSQQYEQNISKSQHWKGSGKLTPGKRFCYILYARSGVTVIIDWRYRGDDRIDFAYKRVGLAGARNYDFDDKQIPVAEKEYLVIWISLPDDTADVSNLGWELGFTVK